MPGRGAGPRRAARARRCTLATTKSTRSRYVRSVWPSIRHAPSSPPARRRVAARRRRCARPSCTAGGRLPRRRTRTAAGRLRRTRRSSSRSCGRPACGWRRRAWRSWSPLRGGAYTVDRLERARDEPERAVPVPLRLVELGVVVVEEEEVFALHVEDQRVRVGRVVAEHARVEQGVEEEGGVGRLRRDAGDPRDVDVRAARAVDEVEVGEQRVAVAAEPDRQLALHAVEEERLIALRRPAPGGPRAPGRGGTYTSGSTRVVVTSAASTASAGSTPSVMRNTSESKRAPSWRARTWVTTPESRTGSARPGTSRSHTTTSSSCRYWSSASGDPERQRGGVLGPEHPSDRLIAHASDGSAGVRQRCSWSDLPLSRGPLCGGVGFAAAPPERPAAASVFATPLVTSLRRRCGGRCPRWRAPRG